MNTNQKGSVAETFAMYKFQSHGFSCYKPIHDYSPIDLLVTKDLSEILRVQVKYLKLQNGKIGIPTDSVVNGKRVPNDLSKIDIWACFIPEYNNMIFVKKGDPLNIRFEPAKVKSSQSLLLSCISDYGINRI
jgi:hypothetical protein